MPVSNSIVYFRDLLDVSVPSPYEGYVPYYDETTGLWQCRIPTDNIYYPDHGLKWIDIGAITADARAITYLGNGIAIMVDGDGHIFRSTDNGYTWTDRGDISSQPSWQFAHLGRGIVVFGDDAGHVFLSADYGSTWADLGVIAYDGIWALVNLGHGFALLGDASGYIFRSTNYGATWSEIDQIISDTIMSLCYLHDGIVLAASLTGHVLRSTDYGLNWSDLGSIAGELYRIEYVGHGIVLCGGANGHIFLSVDDGLNWTDLGVITVLDATVVALRYLGDGVVLAGDEYGYIYRSTNYGKTWGSGTQILSDDIAYDIACLGNGAVILGGVGHTFLSAPAFRLWKDTAAQLDPKDHATSHEPGGSDTMAVDAAAATGSLRTIGTGALQAAAGNHTHTLQEDTTGVAIPGVNLIFTTGSYCRRVIGISSGGDSTKTYFTEGFAAVSRAVGSAMAHGHASANSALKLRLFMGGVQVAESSYVLASYDNWKIIVGTRALSGAQEIACRIHNYAGSTVYWYTYSGCAFVELYGYYPAVGSIKI